MGLGEAIFEIRYEELLGDPEAWVRRCLDYCGLPFDGRCMDFHLTHRVAHTMSSVQVKSPFYTNSIGRWRRYRRHLQPLIDLLGEHHLIGPDEVLE